MLAAMVTVALLSTIAVRGLVAPSDNTAAATTQKQPAIKLQPNSDAPGSIVTVTGTDFSAKSPLSVSVDNKELPADTKVTTKDDGSFTATLKIPNDAKDGNHQIKVSDDKGKSATADFTVVKK
ncbi:IPT/TIG domain-containing protein [Candidatus Nitrososphaera evergladensis SR1]|uniref:IPT/TIG domain-containing protein n=1 Tax=Candidatus Nitrososphaera evergladensis SR1 TaxID=1459636 RepID=A0A075MVB6_9ARCH|nr:IPT/TIG domain-containing protein [Candidatus Nitrososphaera evergladensis SR1]